MAELELLEKMKRAKANDNRRIRQGVISGTSKSGLDEALKVVRGNPTASASRQKLVDVSSSTSSSIDYKVVHPIRLQTNSSITRSSNEDVAKTWSAMLQTADLKSSLEAKIQMLSEQIGNLKQAQSGHTQTPPLQGNWNLNLYSALTRKN